MGPPFRIKLRTSFDAETFWDAPDWREAAPQYRANRPSPPDGQAIERARGLLDDNVSLERAWHEFNARAGRVAEATVEALIFSLRNGIDALSHLDTLRRLCELDDAQLRAVVIRLQRFKARLPSRGRPNRSKSCSPRGAIPMIDKTPEQIADELMAKAGIGKGAARHIKTPWPERLTLATSWRRLDPRPCSLSLPSAGRTG